MEKKILVAGTFDLLHPGHLFFLQQASTLGDTLFVILARDSSVQKIKKISPEQTQEQRFEKISALPFVTQAFIGEKENFLTIPLEINPDIIALGYDQKIPKGLEEALPNTQYIRIKSHFPEKFKSSFFRKKKKKSSFQNLGN